MPLPVSQSSNCFVFCLVGFFVVYLSIFLHLDPDLILPRCLLSLSCDRIPTARMGPAGKLLNVCQGDRKIENYARDFNGAGSGQGFFICHMINYTGYNQK